MAKFSENHFQLCLKGKVEKENKIQLCAFSVSHRAVPAGPALCERSAGGFSHRSFQKIKFNFVHFRFHIGRVPAAPALCEKICRVVFTLKFSKNKIQLCAFFGFT
jgi:hypothetical protein